MGDRRHRWVTRLVAVLLSTCLMNLFMTGAANANGYAHAGWATSSTTTFKAIDGYIELVDVGTLPSLTHHANWFSLWPHGLRVQWVQIGQVQGYWSGDNCCNMAAPEMYWENQDVCTLYWGSNVGPPPTKNYPFYLNYDGGGSHSVWCGGSIGYATYYNYEFRKGSWTSTPFAYGITKYGTNQAEYDTELYGAPPYGTDYYGCDSAHACSNSAYGIHLSTGSGWFTWTTSTATNPASNDCPPCLATIHNYWASLTY
jgi:hypothetical protein